MPFTLSHPIAALPLFWLSRGRLPLDALCIGAMVPDIAYFVAMRPVESAGHSVWGIFAQGLPAGWLLWLSWRGVMAAPLREPWPEAVRCRLTSPAAVRGGVLGALVWVSAAIVFGEVTHVVWDAFTHATGPAVTRWPALLARVYGPLPFYAWLQYGGGVCGAVGLALTALWRLSRATPRPLAPLSTGRKVFFWMLVAVSAVALGVVAQGGAPTGAHARIVRGVIGAVTGGALAMMMWSSAWQIGRGVFLRKGVM